MLLPLLAVAAIVIVGVAWYEKNKTAAPATPGTTPATAAAAGLAVAQAGQAIPMMRHYHGAHVPHIEDQMGQVGAIPMMQHRPGAHIPHIEDQVAAAATIYPEFGVHPMAPVSPVWNAIAQVDMPRVAQADLLKQVRMKNLRGFYKTPFGITLYGLYVGDPRDMRTYVWYRGPMVPWVQPTPPGLRS